MRLSFIFDALATGELHNLYDSDSAEHIREEKKVHLLPAINLGLTDLYTRFFLKRNIEQTILAKGDDTYSIRDDEFIELVKVSFNGRELIANQPDGYVLLNPRTIRWHFRADDNDIIECVYKAKPELLTADDIDKDTDVVLPMAYLNALLYFIASRAYTSIVNQLDGDLNESNRYAQKYQQEIAMLTNQGIDVDDLNEMWLFDVRGFV